MTRNTGLSRRELIVSAAALAACTPEPQPSPSPAPTVDPSPAVASGPVEGGFLVWAQSPSPGRMRVRARAGSWTMRVDGGSASPETGLCARVLLKDLPTGVRVDYEVWFEGPDGAQGPTAQGHFFTPPTRGQATRVLWGGDICGQGFGVPQGGMITFEAMRRQQAQLCLLLGDIIYADNPIPAELPLADGSVWHNLRPAELAASLDTVASSLDDLRGRYRYNLSDLHYRGLLGELGLVATWDDHEVRNNWWAGQTLSDERYAGVQMEQLVARARAAFCEQLPLPNTPEAPLYRVVPWGPHLDLFVLDTRAVRGRVTDNDQSAPDADTHWLGQEQLDWLVEALSKSTATWKALLVSGPLGLVIYDDWRNKKGHEGIAQGRPEVLGRELELAALLSAIKARGVKNTFVLTADVHYAAVHHYDPERAVYKDFEPFREFVAGPLWAATFGPEPIDPSFGPKVEFALAPPRGKTLLPPTDGLQFFGQLDISADGHLRVSLWDLTGQELYAVEMG